jgi:4-hydroxy-tetrahydrodipicolinate synthase
VGAVGIVSVAGNLIPKPLSEMVQLALKGDYTAALKIHAKYYPLFAAFLKLATNPIPIKTAMALAGHCTDELRLPLVGMEQEKIAELSATLKKLGIIG